MALVALASPMPTFSVTIEAKADMGWCIAGALHVSAFDPEQTWRAAGHSNSFSFSSRDFRPTLTRLRTRY
jgi:hypothetical protein